MTMHDERITFEGVYLIGGPNIFRSKNATAFVADCGDKLVMVDSGAGRSIKVLEKNIRELGFDPKKNFTLILARYHIDHIGGAPYFKKQFNCKLVSHVHSYVDNG